MLGRGIIEGGPVSVLALHDQINDHKWTNLI
jgi:hypothetical protein